MHLSKGDEINRLYILRSGEREAFDDFSECVTKKLANLSELEYLHVGNQ